jgi:hypothetical protein
MLGSSGIGVDLRSFLGPLDDSVDAGDQVLLVSPATRGGLGLVICVPGNRFEHQAPEDAAFTDALGVGHWMSFRGETLLMARPMGIGFS